MINAQLMNRIFAKHLPDLALVVAPDGLSGLRMLDSEHPALLLLDCQLPDISGLEVLKSARSAGSTVPVVVVTADARAELEAQMTAAGAECFVTKPFAFSDLLGHIREHVPAEAEQTSEELPVPHAK